MPTVRSRDFFADPVGVARANPCPALRLGAATGEAVVVREPDEIWRILVTDAASFTQGKWKRRARRFVGPTLNTLDGATHRTRRLLLQPALDRRRIARFEDVARRDAKAAISGWPRGEPVVLRRLLDPLSLTIAGEILLSTRLEPDAEQLADDLAIVMTGLARFTPPLPGTREGRALRRVHRRVESLIAARGADAAPDDLVALMLAAGLPRPTIVGEITAFLLAGADEPPSGLAAVLYLLGLHPEIWDRLAVELSHDSPATPSLADAVVTEALRLLPPARHIDRRPTGPTTVGGEPVAPRTNVLVSPTVTHLDDRIFPEADRFDPDRWLTGAPTARSGYLPFGAGPHSCIGEHVARLVMTVVLEEVVGSLTLELASRSEPPIPGRPPLVATFGDRR